MSNNDKQNTPTNFMAAETFREIFRWQLDLGHDTFFYGVEGTYENGSAIMIRSYKGSDDMFPNMTFVRRYGPDPGLPLFTELA